MICAAVIVVGYLNRNIKIVVVPQVVGTCLDFPAVCSIALVYIFSVFVPNIMALFIGFVK